MGRPFPIVEYAHKINKNTSDFTVNDLVAFMKWWVKQPVRKDIMAMKNEFMQKGAKTGRAVSQEAQEEVQQESEAVIELGLTQLDIDALKWALKEIFENYELKGSAYGKPLLDLKQQLDGLEEA